MGRGGYRGRETHGCLLGLRLFSERLSEAAATTDTREGWRQQGTLETTGNIGDNRERWTQQGMLETAGNVEDSREHWTQQGTLETAGNVGDSRERCTAAR